MDKEVSTTDKFAGFPTADELQEALHELQETDDTLDIVLPNWLPMPIKEPIEDHCNILRANRNSVGRVIHYDSYSYLAKDLREVLPVFTSLDTQDIWSGLFNISEEKSVMFVRSLLMCGNAMDGTLGLFNKHKRELGAGKKILKIVKSLHDQLEEYQIQFYGHFISDEFNQLDSVLTKILENMPKEIEDFEEEHKSLAGYAHPLWPVSRESKSKFARPIFFARRIHLDFMNFFGKPMHNFISRLVNAMFDTAYTENDIIKIVKPTRRWFNFSAEKNS